MVKTHYVHYRPQRSCKGYIFTPICHSVYRGRVCLSACWDTTPRSRQPPLGPDTPWEQAPPRPDTTPVEQAPTPDQTPPRTRHPWEQAPPKTRQPPQQTATVADGTHPTGMHSCFLKCFVRIYAILCAGTYIYYTTVSYLA